MTQSTDQKSTLISRNITVLGKRTSVRLEPEMWNALREIARRESCKPHDICSLISLRKNPNTSLTAAIRVFLMLYYRAAATEEGHQRAGHGDFENMVRRASLNVSVLENCKEKQDDKISQMPNALERAAIMTAQRVTQDDDSRTAASAAR